MPITFKKASIEHEEIIFIWLAQPHIQAFWDNTQEHQDDIRNFLHQRQQYYFYGTTHYWVGYFNQEPFSFIVSDEIKTSQVVTQPLHKKYLSKIGHTITLDFAIGNREFLGKGLAASTLQAFMKFYQEEVDPLVEVFFIDPDKNNPRAKHVYEKAGFKTVGFYKPEAGAFINQETELMVNQISRYDPNYGF